MGSIEQFTWLGLDVAGALAETGFGSVNGVLGILTGNAVFPELL